MDNGIEREVLERISESLVADRSEIIRFLEGRVENPAVVVDAITKSLYTKGLITYVTPIGRSCYAITQRGLRAVRK